MPQLADGYSTTITLALAPGTLPLSLKLWEKTVTPFGVDGGGSIPITTMRNLKFRTFAPKQLITLNEMTITASYDPQCYTIGIASYINNNGLITCNFPDGSQLAVYGYLDSYKPQENTEGNQPMVTVTVIPTMQNGVFAGVNRFGFGFDTIGVEIAPIYTPGP
jgi:hypothetical protein